MALRHALSKRSETVEQKHCKRQEYLSRFGESAISDVLEEFPDVQVEKLFTARDRETSAARRVALLFLHDLVLRGRGQRELAAYVGLSPVTVCIAIDRARYELKHSRTMRPRIENAAHVAGVPLEFFW